MKFRKFVFSPFLLAFGCSFLLAFLFLYAYSIGIHGAKKGRKIFSNLVSKLEL